MQYSLWQKLKLASAFWKVVKNPLDVSEFNRTTDELLDRAIFAEVFSKLNEDPASKLAMISKTQMKSIAPEAFHFYSKGSLGKAYKDYMMKHKIVIHKTGFDANNPVSYLRYRYRHYNHIWRIILGYDVSVTGQTALHTFLYAQTKSAVSMIYVVLSLSHAIIFRRTGLKAVLESIIDGWQKGQQYKMLWGVPFENHFAEDLEAVRNKYRHQLVSITPPPIREDSFKKSVGL